MSKKRKDWRLYLLDMLECIKRIENYVEGLSYEQFLMDDKTKDAVVRNIEIIEEASRNIPKEIQTRYIHIPWVEIISTRHVIAHDYFDLDYEIIWSIIVQDIPVLKRELELILREINNQPSFDL
jgi:Uncharacterized conserved protein